MSDHTNTTDLDPAPTPRRRRLIVVAAVTLVVVGTVMTIHRVGSRLPHEPQPREAEGGVISLLCPVDGVVGAFLVTEGQLVTNGQALARIHSTELHRAVIEARAALSEARLDLRYATLLLESLRTSSARDEQLRRTQLSALHEQQVEQLKLQRERERELATRLDASQAEVDRNRLDPFVTGTATGDATRERELSQLRSQYEILRSDIDRREAMLAGYLPTRAGESPGDHRLGDVAKSVTMAEEALHQREAEWGAAVELRDYAATVVRAPGAGQVLRFICHEGDALRQAAPALVMQRLEETYVKRFLAPRK